MTTFAGWGCREASSREAQQAGLDGARATGDAPARQTTGLDTALRERLEGMGDPLLDSLYGDSAQNLWVDDDGLTDQGRAALQALRDAAEEGLPARLYDLGDLQELEDADDVDDLVRLETLLTRSVARLGRDLASGVVASTSWDPGLELDSLDVPVFPEGPANGEAMLARLEAVRPGVEQYDRLVEVRARLLEIREAGGWPAVDQGTLLEQGDTSSVVAQLRARLQQSLSAEERRLAEEGAQRPEYLDEALSEALSLFQQRHDIVRDGILGPETAEALNEPVEDRITHVELALERWRWLPADLGALAVVVNTPGRRVHVLEDGRARLSMKTIIGQRNWRTALFQDEMVEIVVNPYWNIPESIMREETLPRAVADPGYLAGSDLELVDPTYDHVVPRDSLVRQAMESGDRSARMEALEVESIVVVDTLQGDTTRIGASEGGSGEGVSGDSDATDGSVLDTLATGSFSYRIRQRPGDQNALGRVKFMFPNEYNIYLHDTPHDHLFDERLRTFSHGCVRVEHPTELAHLLLSEASSIPPARFDSLQATGEQHVLELDEPVPTYLIYQTVWVEEDGAPIFTPDVYERNEEALAALEEALQRGAGASP